MATHVFSDFSAEGNRLLPTLPQMGLLDLTIKKRHMFVSGYVDGNLIPLPETHHRASSTDQEWRAQTVLPLVLLRCSPAERSLWVERVLADSGLNNELCPGVANRVMSLAFELSDYARCGFQITVDVEVTIAEEVNEEEEEEAQAGDAVAAPRVITTMREKEYGGDEGKCCSICLEEFAATSRVMETPCSHTFHTACILSWLEMRDSCPMCRRQVD